MTLVAVSLIQRIESRNNLIRAELVDVGGKHGQR
jgi:hypothetical protein